MKFTYTSGQRPLDGFTIKRGIGRGGFGEVYFAVSDGGKEVALKLVRGDQQVELRGVAHCLNLKHPNLVALYDLRKDTQGDHWVVMEYIAGEPLNVVLARHPNGLPRELVREWFPALARAVAYLHDHGIVHRDLKPANVFIENGTVKIGDYGLSKSISTSGRTANTESVGTVHYMAPEISTGNYGKQIDTYAAGIILYELITGQVPFDGQSAGEILMKHLTTPPDLSKLPAEWSPIVHKALCKNPAHRYASMAEMARDVEKIGPESEPARPTPLPPPLPSLSAKSVSRQCGEPVRDSLPTISPRQQVAELCWSLCVSVAFAALATALYTALHPQQILDHTSLSLFFLTVAASWAILIPTKFWQAKTSDSITRRLVLLGLGGCVGLLACWLDGWSPSGHPLYEEASLASIRLFPQLIAVEASYFAYYGLAFAVLRWWRMTERRRLQRFSFAPILGAGFWAVVLLLIIRPPHQPWHSLAALVVVMAAAIVQLVSPWEPPPPAPARRLRLRYT
jgi:serine/threonine protein kinase